MHNKIIINCIFLLIFSIIHGYSNPNQTTTGFIKIAVQDARTSTPIVATIQLIPMEDTANEANTANNTSNLFWQTDSAGVVLAQHVPVGDYTLRVQAYGYHPFHRYSFKVKTNQNHPVSIPLQSKDIQSLHTTQVTVAHSVVHTPWQSTGATTLNRDQINNSPGSSQDINRVLQTLPAANGGGDDNWNTFLVRGGQSHENIFLLDGIEVNNISHWGDDVGSGGTVSMLHLDFVRSLDFYASGFPAYMPPQISSVTNITFREGSVYKPQTQFDLNMAGMGFFTEGPIQKGKSSYMLNGRISFLELIQIFMPWDGVPKYQNGQSKFYFSLNPRNEVHVNLLAGNEQIEFTSGQSSKLFNQGQHLITGVDWRYNTDDMSNSLLFSATATNYLAKETNSNQIQSFYYESRRRSFQLKNSLELYPFANDIVNLGFSASTQHYNDQYASDSYFLAIQADTFAFVPELFPSYPDSLYRDTLGGETQGADTLGYKVGGHLGYLFKPSKLGIQTGLRSDYYSLLHTVGWSPGVSIHYDFSNTQRSAISLERRSQFPDYAQFVTLNQKDSSWKLSDYELQRATLAALSYTASPLPWLTIQADVYYKVYDREPRYSLEVDTTTSSSSSSSSITQTGSRTITHNPFTYSEKKSYGIELFFKRDANEKYWLECSYSYKNTLQQYHNQNQKPKWYPSDNSFHHKMIWIAGYKINASNTLSLRADVSDGLYYTPIDENLSKQQYKTVYDLDHGWNAKQRPTRIQFSPRYSSYSYFSWGSIESYMEVTNLFNNTYIVHQSYDRGASPADGSIATYYSKAFMIVGGVSISF